MGVLSSLKPAKVFEFFEYLSSVPHGSGNTKAISDLCVKFAEERGLRVVQDKINNIFIYKPATPGYENAPGVILQAHLDMVCAKRPGDPIDMKTTPVKLMTDGEYVWADGTSLGGDDLSGVAMSMAVLDDDTLPHPAIEAFFSVDEESGMDGVFGFDPSLIKHRLLINLDSEEEGVFTAGCAGGIGVKTVFPVERTVACGCSVGMRLTVSGLLGGHSGVEIDKERGNSHLIAARVLFAAMKRGCEIRLDTFEGGSFGNVIPSKTVSVFTVPADEKAELIKIAEEYRAILADEYAVSDPGLTLTLEDCDKPEKPVTAECTRRMLSMLVTLPYGVQHMSMDLPGLVQTSLNLGVIKLNGDALRFANSIRSSVASQKHEIADKVETIVAAFGGKTQRTDGYPEWKFKRVSAFRDTALEAYRRVYGGEATVFATHGGLECGILAEKLPGLDSISFGPELHDIHSVNEKMGVASIGRTYRLLCELLSMLK
ncbi:MAG: aminoacyl-histidine dipeptidase [Clostridia bacterium]|nr:aminoacyl-histidine dipeptidase [Clostridia bacterium]